MAGPIIRPSELLPQLKTWLQPTEEQKWTGLQLIAFGYFKKLVIADNLAPAVNWAFGSGSSETAMPFWWIIMSMFAFQIYCDFSGYSDIARGLARWMGYDFPLNFNHPYIAKSFKDFWRRWHISLSTWFRDYVYIPLGGSQRGLFAGLFFMSITMVISGFWHGAAWTFIIWGALHALYLALERLTGWPDKLSKAIPGGTHLVTLLILVQVWIAWVFFRATAFSQAGTVLGRMFDFSQLSYEPNRIVESSLPFLAIGIAV